MIKGLLLLGISLSVGEYTPTQKKGRQILLNLELLQGFTTDICADNLPNARQPALSNNAIVYVGNREADNMYTMDDCNQHYKADTVFTIASDLRMPGSMFSESQRNTMVSAESKSWNRTEKIGYRIAAVSLENEKATSYKPFVSSWFLDNDSVWGHPVDFLEIPDRSELVSDDYNGFIYRISNKN